MPSWYAGLPKKTRSPGRGLDTRVVASCCAAAVRGRLMPCWAKTYWMYPEQSKPGDGEVPPQVYGVPTKLAAVLSTELAEYPGSEEPPPPPVDPPVEPPEPLMPIALPVFGPTMPSAVRPWLRCQRLTAERVFGPNTPSAEAPTTRCT